MQQVDVKFPPAFADLFRPYSYKVYYGGRAGLKSWQFARALALRASREPLRIACGREYQNTIKDSVHKLLSDQIKLLSLQPYLDVQEKRIYGTLSGAEFFFKGFYGDVDEAVRSMEGVDILWLEEAHRLSEKSWTAIVPTIMRKPGAQIWVSFNTMSEDDPTYKRTVALTAEQRRHLNMAVHKVTYKENPWLSQEARMEVEHCKRTNYDAYLHVWEGEPLKHSDAVIFRKKYRVASFETPKDVDRFFYGADWGFAQDPFTINRSFIVGRTLFVDREQWGIGVDIDKLPGRFRLLFDSESELKRAIIKADNARPETISYINKHGNGLHVVAAKKWDGSVEDGVDYMLAFDEIVIHEKNCPHLAEEARLYRYKTDRVTGDVLRDIVDANNHGWDALRYAHDDRIRSGNTGLLDFMAAQAAANAKRQGASDQST